ncbi:MAG: nitronate monooxygenase [Atopobiaceae bacterium]|nr:nitronate monooxygenase [Atopobiaceae bacterium]
MDLPELRIGDVSARVPIIQGGMGVGVSLSSLAGAVAKEGGVGIISAAQPGFLEEDFRTDPFGANLRALGRYIREAKAASAGCGGLVGVNIMCACTHYEEYVRCCIDNGADLIISGAVLPMNLAKLVEGSDIKIAPIGSPPRAVSTLHKLCDRHAHRTADMVVIEGPAAGGHLGYSKEEAEDAVATGDTYDAQIADIMERVHVFEEKYDRKIPVVFAGGVFTHEDICHYLGLGCAGVQMATRFVVTEECDADQRYKQAYLDATKDDIRIVKSPVGMPGRAIDNAFLRHQDALAAAGERPRIEHCFNCLTHCNPTTAPYCITDALIRAARGDVDKALLFCGENVWRLHEMTTVPALMHELEGAV